MSSSPATLPITNQQASQPQPQINTHAFRTFLSRLSSSLRESLSTSSMVRTHRSNFLR
ncbi:hypothetical protein AALP_AA4G188900 [Arabis alpina]|uniref:Uncharacterized protein n=1 Tax=Arabis alpina TaxID=50452 RepID=A0A087H459_ARAAL|nr:hypothetical protein AALP_AA4G188900 [Arabis alpina]